MAILIDSYGWFEYFFGSKKGETVRSIVGSGERIVISQINLFEVYYRYLKNAPAEAEEKKALLLTRCELADVDKETALAAAKIKAEHHLGMADAIVFATAKKHNCRLLTGDKHFEKLPEVEFLK